MEQVSPEIENEPNDNKTENSPGEEGGSGDAKPKSGTFYKYIP